VLSHDANDAKFVVKYKDTGVAVKVYRIHLCFQAENPFLFAQRVAAAHQLRREFESQIRYALYVDNMPTDELSPLDTEQVNRILVLALNTKKLKQNALDTTSLLSEVNIDYARTMNKIIFDLNLTRPALAQVSSALRMLENKEEALAKFREKPWLGVMPVPRHDFPKHFSDFCFNSFYTKGEAIKALVDVNEQCLKLTELSLFNTRISKSQTLSDF